MSQPYVTAPGRWFFSTTANLYYYYDALTDQFVYESGHRVPAPFNVLNNGFRSSQCGGLDEAFPLADQYTGRRSLAEVRAFSISSSSANTSRISSTSDSSSRSPVSTQGTRSSVGSSSSQGLQSASSGISPSPVSPPSWLAHTIGNQQTQDREREADESLENLGRAFPCLSLVADHATATNQSDIHRWVQPSDHGRVLNVLNNRNQVMGTFQMEPKEAITDSRLYDDGVRAYRMLCETPNEEEKLYASFKRSLKPKKFFSYGKVFLILWVEPAGETNQSDVTSGTATTSMEITKGRFGEAVFSKVRRFVVVREGELHCTALPVLTYGGKGVSKAGVKKSDHAIIYTGRTAPIEAANEAPVRGEEGMRPRAIRVDVDSKEDKLDIMSRIDFGKPHTIHHNLKVRSFGKVNRDSHPHLEHQFRSVWSVTGGGSQEPKKSHRSQPASLNEAGRRKDKLDDIWQDAYESLISKGYSHDRAFEFLQQRDSSATQVDVDGNMKL